MLKGGFAGFVKRVEQSGAGFSKGNHKNVIVRSAAIAMSKSSSKATCSVNKDMRVKEAQATLRLGKKLGIVTKGQDSEVTQK